MNFEINYQDSFLIIRLSGPGGSNERLLSKKPLLSPLQPSYRKFLVDLSDLKRRGGKRNLNAMIKEIHPFNLMSPKS